MDVSENSIGCTGLQSLQLALLHSETLLSLRLAQNGILSRGPVIVGGCLSSSVCALQHLDLSANIMCGKRSDSTFDPKPILYLGEVLMTSNRALTSLDLSRSDIGARSTKRLMEALLQNTVLHTVNLYGCNISEEGANHVAEAMPDLKGLRNLNIGNCGIGPLGCQVS